MRARGGRGGSPQREHERSRADSCHQNSVSDHRRESSICVWWSIEAAASARLQTKLMASAAEVCKAARSDSSRPSRIQGTGSRRCFSSSRRQFPELQCAPSPMSRAPSNEGLRSEPLRAALTAALAGKPAALEDLLRRHGDGHGARPNFRLAAAFGAEMAALPATASRLLDRLGANDGAPDTPEVFL